MSQFNFCVLLLCTNSLAKFFLQPKLLMLTPSRLKTIKFRNQKNFMSFCYLLYAKLSKYSFELYFSLFIFILSLFIYYRFYELRFIRFFSIQPEIESTNVFIFPERDSNAVASGEGTALPSHDRERTKVYRCSEKPAGHDSRREKIRRTYENREKPTDFASYASEESDRGKI